MFPEFSWFKGYDTERFRVWGFFTVEPVVIDVG